jgi:hypothetical protein
MDKMTPEEKLEARKTDCQNGMDLLDIVYKWAKDKDKPAEEFYAGFVFMIMFLCSSMTAGKGYRVFQEAVLDLPMEIFMAHGSAADLMDEGFIPRSIHGDVAVVSPQGEEIGRVGKKEGIQ